MNNAKKIITASALAGAPLLMFAQTSATTILRDIGNIFKILIPILITAGLIYFIYGVVRYVIASDADDREKAKSIVTRGIIGLFVVISVWGLIGIIQSTFGIGSGGSLNSSNIPDVQLK